MCLFPTQELSSLMCITHFKSQYAAHCFNSKTHYIQIVPQEAILPLSKLLMSPILYVLIPLIVEHTDINQALEV